MREILNGIFYVMRAGCPWRLLPNDLPPWETIYRWFAAWRDDGRFELINHALVMADRERVGRDASPRLRSSTARASRPLRPAARAVTMPEKSSTGASATRSSIRTGVASCSNRTRRASKIAMVADRLCEVSRHIFPFIERVFADSGYAGEKVAKATLIAVEIVRKNPDQVGFAVNPRRWVVERFFAWIGRNRRLAKELRGNINSARAFLYAASVMLLVRRIARAS